MHDKNPDTTERPAAAGAGARYTLRMQGQMLRGTAATLGVAAERHELTFMKPGDKGADKGIEVKGVDVLLSDDRIATTAAGMNEAPLVVPRIDVRIHRADGEVDCYDTDVCFHSHARNHDRLPTTTAAVGTRIEEIAHRMAQVSGLPIPSAKHRRAALMKLCDHPAVGETAQGSLLTRAVKDEIAPLVSERWSGIVIEWNRNGATTIHYRKEP